MTEQSDKPSVEGLMTLVYEYGNSTDGKLDDSLAALDAIRAYAERLAALAGPLEQPQEPKEKNRE